MDAKLIALWDRGVTFLFEGDAFRSRKDIPVDDIYGLDLSVIQISDPDVETVLSLHKLSIISFSNTTLSNEQLKLLPRLSRLSELILSRTPISDAAVPTLLGMSSLEYLDVADTSVTPDGIAELRKGLPDTTIHS